MSVLLQVNHLLYVRLRNQGLVEMVDATPPPAWRAAPSALEGVADKPDGLEAQEGRVGFSISNDDCQADPGGLGPSCADVALLACVDETDEVEASGVKEASSDQTSQQGMRHFVGTVTDNEQQHSGEQKEQEQTGDTSKQDNLHGASPSDNAVDKVQPQPTSVSSQAPTKQQQQQQQQQPLLPKLQQPSQQQNHDRRAGGGGGLPPTHRLPSKRATSASTTTSGDTANGMHATSSTDTATSQGVARAVAQQRHKGPAYLDSSVQSRRIQPGVMPVSSSRYDGGMGACRPASKYARTARSPQLHCTVQLQQQQQQQRSAMDTGVANLAGDGSVNAGCSLLQQQLLQAAANWQHLMLDPALQDLSADGANMLGGSQPVHTGLLEAMIASNNFQPPVSNLLPNLDAPVGAGEVHPMGFTTTARQDSSLFLGQDWANGMAGGAEFGNDPTQFTPIARSNLHSQHALFSIAQPPSTLPNVQSRPFVETLSSDLFGAQLQQASRAFSIGVPFGSQHWLNSSPSSSHNSLGHLAHSHTPSFSQHTGGMSSGLAAYDTEAADEYEQVSPAVLAAAAEAAVLEPAPLKARASNAASSGGEGTAAHDAGQHGPVHVQMHTAATAHAAATAVAAAQQQSTVVAPALGASDIGIQEPAALREVNISTISRDWSLQPHSSSPKAQAFSHAAILSGVWGGLQRRSGGVSPSRRRSPPGGSNAVLGPNDGITKPIGEAGTKRKLPAESAHQSMTDADADCDVSQRGGRYAHGRGGKDTGTPKRKSGRLSESDADSAADGGYCGDAADVACQAGSVDSADSAGDDREGNGSCAVSGTTGARLTVAGDTAGEAVSPKSRQQFSGNTGVVAHGTAAGSSGQDAVYGVQGAAMPKGGVNTATTGAQAELCSEEQALQLLSRLQLPETPSGMVPTPQAVPAELQQEYERRMGAVRDLVAQLNDALQGLKSIREQVGQDGSCSHDDK